MPASAPPLVWSESFDNTWEYDGLRINYISAGPDQGTPFLLVHGFGASGFHWRRNVNVLASAGYRVYAIDLIGFGLSSKPVIEYDASLWREQCAAFLRDVGGCGAGKRAILAGNSIGGYTALMTGSKYPDLVAGVASLNGAGQFAPTADEKAAALALDEQRAARSAVQAALDGALEQLSVSLQRFAAYAGLFVTKQPARIQQVLRQVYPVNPDMADEELVESIRYPADDPVGLAPPGKIPEVFYRIVSRNGRGGSVTLDELLAGLSVPLLLLWGELDPWIVSAKGDAIEAKAAGLGVDVRRVSVNAGHCPQDEAPEEVNAALLDFACSLGL
eukprot:CAMPEP_0183337958 /NCGR_PEP_ID=MMETSP0164_2-20130417/5420_1 /TAXON_ID=221442 /ORGANISM="Coccolithus pelagicus ssp braarudi, Strain PLY182g" /LENGTH=330 /DNA_ID=CAMNT_0025507731 /DNA_START=147 /DNA_END=1139 /DNA_ORIENTATION=-